MDDDEVQALADERSLVRLLALSDGVFAIAMTLLVLDVKVPAELPDGDVAGALRDQVSGLAAYALSFAVTGLFWAGHRRVFTHVRAVDERLVVANLVLLAFVALIPFPTALLGAHGDTVAATVAYAAVLACTGLAAALPPLEIRRARLHHDAVEGRHFGHGAARVLTLTVVFAASIPVALVSVTAAQLTWTAIIPARVLLARRDPTRQVRSARR